MYITLRRVDRLRRRRISLFIFKEQDTEKRELIAVNVGILNGFSSFPKQEKIFGQLHTEYALAEQRGFGYILRICQCKK